MAYHSFPHSVSHAFSWAVLKPHMLLIIQEIIFPIMQYTEDDEDLYQNDTIEYIRRKFGKSQRNFDTLANSNQKLTYFLRADIYDDYSTPVPAAQVLFLSCCKVRKGILPQAIGFLNSVSILEFEFPIKFSSTGVNSINSNIKLIIRSFERVQSRKRETVLFT